MEPACFLQLFNGRMVVYAGKRDDDEKRCTYRLFVVLHEHGCEASLLEVPCEVESLRR